MALLARSPSHQIARHCKTCSRGSAIWAWDRLPSSVRVVDVSPRDGLQNEPVPVTTADKLQLISRLRDAGVRSIEATAFVSPKAVPQMADAADVMEGIRENSDTGYTVLVPNLKGLDAATKSGAREVTVLAAATETMSRRNTKCSLSEALDRASAVIECAKSRGIRTRGAIAVAMACPYEGDVPESQVVAIVERMHAEGCDEIMICDTIGKATPGKTRRLLQAIHQAGVPSSALALHVHDTYGQATANMLVGLQEGVSVMDAAVAGLGGCPFAGPGVSGNLASEDLVYMLHGLGIETGIDLDRLSETGDWICGKLGKANGSRAGAATMARLRNATRSSVQGTTSSGSPMNMQTRCFRTCGASQHHSARMSKTLPMSTASGDRHPGPLAGYRVVELGNFLAGPFCATNLAYFGAEVIKIETPGKGDPIRYWRSLAADGQSPWSRSLLRNKRCITVNLKSADGVAIVRRLIEKADAVVENFRPGVLEKFGLGPDDFKDSNPGLIFARISGYGQTGPYRSRAGFASATEGEGGFRFVNGVPGEAPVRPNLSLGDTLAGIQAAFGVTMALLNRTRTGKGQVVDMALYEAVYNVMEGVIPEYSCLGQVRQPSGTTVSGIVPTNTHRCKDGKFVVVGANSDQIFVRVMRMMGRVDMAEDERYKHNAGRVEHQEYIYKVIDDWTGSLLQSEVLAKLQEVGCPAGPIYDAADMLADPHFNARGMFEEVVTPSGVNLKIPAMVPKLSDTPGKTQWCGPDVGAHTQQVLMEELGYSESDVERLRSTGAIGSE